MEEIILTAFANETLVFWAAIALIVIIPGVTWIIAEVWASNRQAEIDASLKHRMLEMGMSAGEIERVIAARTDSTDDSPHQVVVQSWQS